MTRKNCTYCEKPLTDKEIEENKEMENNYYIVCDNCVTRHSMNILKIILAES